MEAQRSTSIFSPLADLLAEHGFDAVKGTTLYPHLYRKGELYIGVSVSFDPRDAPFFCRVSLGEGSIEMPDADWNSTALWRLVKAKAPGHYAAGTEPYGFKPGEDVGPVALRVRDDLQQFGQDFLQGDLRVFRRARAEQNQERQPYLVHRPGPDGKYQTEAEPSSQTLKERYSRPE